MNLLNYITKTILIFYILSVLYARTIKLINYKANQGFDFATFGYPEPLWVCILLTVFCVIYLFLIIYPKNILYNSLIVKLITIVLIIFFSLNIILNISKDIEINKTEIFVVVNMSLFLVTRSYKSSL